MALAAPPTPQSAEIIIRHPHPGESLIALFPDLESHVINRDNVWVAEMDGHLAGGCLVWDGGHDIVHVGELVIPESCQRRGVGTALQLHVMRDLAAKGKRTIIGWTQHLAMAALLQQRGAKVTTPLFLILWEVA